MFKYLVNNRFFIYQIFLDCVLLRNCERRVKIKVQLKEHQKYLVSFLFDLKANSRQSIYATQWQFESIRVENGARSVFEGNR